MQTVKDIFGYSSTPKLQNIGDLLDAQPDSNRITMIGTMGSGKSAFLAGLLVAADRKVNKSENTDFPFRYYLKEGSGNIEHDKSALRAGHFPPKTGALKASIIEPGLTFEWAHETALLGKRVPLSKKQAYMPICDLAGEDLCRLIEKVNQIRTLQQASQINEQRMISMITQSTGLMLIIKATRAQGLGIEIEQEPIGIEGLAGATGRNTEAGGDWSATYLTDVSDAIEELETDGYFGPYKLIVTPTFFGQLRQVLANYGWAFNAVNELLGGSADSTSNIVVSNSLYATHDSAQDSALVIDTSPGNFELIVAQDISNYMQQLPSMNYKGKVWEAVVPVIKRPQAICEITGLT